MKKHKYKQDKLCIRPYDKSIFIPSSPDNYTHGQAMADCMLGNIKWYFKRVELKKKWFIKYWEETGEIWKPKEGKEFTVVNYKDIEK